MSQVVLPYSSKIFVPQFRAALIGHPNVVPVSGVLNAVKELLAKGANLNDAANSDGMHDAAVRLTANYLFQALKEVRQNAHPDEGDETEMVLSPIDLIRLGMIAGTADDGFRLSPETLQLFCNELRASNVTISEIPESPLIYFFSQRDIPIGAYLSAQLRGLIINGVSDILNGLRDEDGRLTNDHYASYVMSNSFPPITHSLEHVNVAGDKQDRLDIYAVWTLSKGTTVTPEERDFFEKAGYDISIADADELLGTYGGTMKVGTGKDIPNLDEKYSDTPIVYLKVSIPTNNLIVKETFVDSADDFTLTPRNINVTVSKRTG